MVYPYGGMNMVQLNHVINDRIAYIRYNASMVFLPCFYCTLSYTIAYPHYSPVQAITALATVAPINSPRVQRPGLARAIPGPVQLFYAIYTIGIIVYTIGSIYGVFVRLSRTYIGICPLYTDRVTPPTLTLCQNPNILPHYSR